MVFLPALVLAAVASASPAPSAPPLKVIVHVHSSALCTELHRAIIPFVVAEQKNNTRFMAMDQQLGKYHQWYRPPSDAATDPNGSPEINGAQALAAAQIDQNAALMYEDIAHVEKLLKASEHVTPTGRDPELDALRTRAQHILDLQREVANRYEEQAGTYLNSIGSFVPMPTAQSKGDPALQSAFDIPQLDQDPIAAARPLSQVHPFATPAPGSQYGQQQNDIPSNIVVQSMIAEENAFAQPAVSAIRRCLGE
jgi:hypothetical protein